MKTQRTRYFYEARAGGLAHKVYYNTTDKQGADRSNETASPDKQKSESPSSDSPFYFQLQPKLFFRLNHHIAFNARFIIAITLNDNI